jgi:hypothetical protein
MYGPATRRMRRVGHGSIVGSSSIGVMVVAEQLTHELEGLKAGELVTLAHVEDAEKAMQTLDKARRRDRDAFFSLLAIGARLH